MRVYIKELGITDNLRLYDLNGEECAERIMKEMIFNGPDKVLLEIMTDREGNEYYGIGVKVYKELVNTIGHLQRMYDEVRNEMIEGEIPLEKMAKELRKRGGYADLVKTLIYNQKKAVKSERCTYKPSIKEKLSEIKGQAAEMVSGEKKHMERSKRLIQMGLIMYSKLGREYVKGDEERLSAFLTEHEDEFKQAMKKCNSR